MQPAHAAGPRRGPEPLRAAPRGAWGARLCALWLSYLLLLYPAAALYHTASETLHWFSHTAQKLPDRMRYSSLTDKATGVTVPLATLGRRLGAAKAPGAAPPPRVVFVFGEHCREVITSEVGLWLGRLLADEHSHVRQWPELHEALERAGEAPAGGGADGSSSAAWPMTVDAWASELLEQLSIQIIPILSLEGRRMVEGGNLCIRKTAQTGVDLNRNWPFAWQRSAPSNEQYGGPQPLSEPQSRIVKDLLDERPVAAYINVHSGEWALYTPWDSKPAYAPDLPADMSELVTKLGDICECTTGPAGAVSGYLAFGSSMDYAYVHRQVPYPLTVEVYGSNRQGKLRQGTKNKPLKDFPVQQLTPPSPGSSGDSKGEQAKSAAGRRLLAGAPAGAPAAPGLRLALTSPAPRWGERRRQLQQQGRPEQGQQQRRQRQQLPAGAALPDRIARRLQDSTDEVMAAYMKAPEDLKRCFEVFNPLEESEYRRVVGDWLAAFLIALRHVAAHVATGSAQEMGGGGGGGGGDLPAFP